MSRLQKVTAIPPLGPERDLKTVVSTSFRSPCPNALRERPEININALRVISCCYALSFPSFVSEYISCNTIGEARISPLRRPKEAFEDFNLLSRKHALRAKKNILGHTHWLDMRVIQKSRLIPDSTAHLIVVYAIKSPSYYRRDVFLHSNQIVFDRIPFILLFCFLCSGQTEQ